MPFEYLFNAAWQWFADTGINLAILLTIAFLVPRAGRLANRIVEARIAEKGDEEEAKGQLALTGVGVYIAQIVAYFILVVLILQQVGFSLAGAAIPATVVSAAIGFGAQSVIADFLSGFFIITEKQYGVGDWVAFEGTGSTASLEGTVIQFTMRSTQIRTIDQSTVTIPNSTARVAVNRSKYWSRAVVVMPVPLLGSQSSEEALTRAERATRLALAREDIAQELLGELDVHPAVGVTPPTTVGMPWTVDMRFMIQVKAGSQWLVERAVRMSILNEFWNEYGSATTTSGALIEAVHTPEAPFAANEAITQTRIDEQNSPKNDPEGDTELFSESFPAVIEATGDTGRMNNDLPDDLPTDSDATEILPAATDAEEAERKEPTSDSDQPDVPAAFDKGDGEDPAVAEKKTDDEDEDSPEEESSKSKFFNIITLGRKMRMSTAGLLILLAFLLVLRGLTFSATAGEDGRVAGILAPPVASTAPETPTEETEPPAESEGNSHAPTTNQQPEGDTSGEEQNWQDDQQAPSTQQNVPQEQQQQQWQQEQQAPTTSQPTQQQPTPTQQQQQTQVPTVNPNSAETNQQSETTVR